MVANLDNKQISMELKAPISTIQRRIRKLIQKGIIALRAEINAEVLGLKRGVVHVYISNSNIDQIATVISNLDLVDSVEICLGNSDMNANIIYTENMQVIDTILNTKKIIGVEKILWVEKVYTIRNSDNKIFNLLNSN
jgi:DNA-binding Lrp family transcriptional regulator